MAKTQADWHILRYTDRGVVECTNCNQVQPLAYNMWCAKCNSEPTYTRKLILTK